MENMRKGVSNLQKKPMTWRKTAQAWTAILLTVALIVGCSSGSNNGGSGSDSGEGSGDAEPKMKSFTLWTGWASEYTNDTLIQDLWKEEMGFDVKVEGTNGDVMTALNLKMNSGGFSDAAVFPNNEVYKSALIKSGLIMPLDEYFNMPDKYPNLAQIPEQYLELSRSEDGHIWFIPTWWDQNPDEPWFKSVHAWWVRIDLLEKVGMTKEDLATLAGVESFLREVSKLKDDNGRPILPIGFVDRNYVNILSAFGVSSAMASGGTTPVEKKGDEIVFDLDDPGYKEAYVWMNKMYREGLLDQEVVTQKQDRYMEKIASGQYAMIVGNAPNTMWEGLDGPTEPGWFLKPVPNPKVPGVESLGYVELVNPYPAYSVFISKNTKNLDAILSFLDYTLEKKPERQQEVVEGPVGKYWFWTGEPLGEWDFVESYKADRLSADRTKHQSLTPSLWHLSTYSNKWYPWWTNRLDEDVPEGFGFTRQFIQEISQFGNTRSVHAYDLVPVAKGGLWEKYGLTLQNVRNEYHAKLLMAKTDQEFEQVWNTFREQLEKQAHWSELKREWHEQYEALKAKMGDF